MERIGVYSGTFDPIHQGHLAFARETMRAGGLTKVVFLPEREPRDKHDVTAIAHRTALITRAIRGNRDLQCFELPTPLFTVKDTLPLLRTAFGAAELTFLIGSDVVRTFLYRWDGLAELFSQASFAIGMRAGDDPAEVAAIMAQMSRQYMTTVRYELIFTSAAEARSSSIRNGTVSASDLPPEVLNYIKEHSLYARVVI